MKRNSIHFTESIRFVQFGLMLFLLLNAQWSAASGDDAGVSSYPHSDVRSVVKSFPATGSSTLEITNKYGDIHTHVWDKDSIRIEVKVTAESDDQEYMDLLSQMAEVRFTHSGSVVRAELLWGEKVSTFKRSSVDVTLSVSKNHKLTIDYQVFLPAGTSMKIENRFGDLKVGEVKGKFYATLFHGDLQAEMIRDARSVVVKYGRIDVQEVVEGSFDLSFGDINILRAGEVRIESSGSEISIEEVNTLDLRSSNDKIDIEKVNKLNGSSSISDVRIRLLSGSMQFSSKFGDLFVRKIERDFQQIDLSGSSSEVQLGFDATAAFGFEFQLENSKGFSFPSASVSVEDDVTVEKKRTIKGSFGRNSAVVKVKVAMRGTSIRFYAI